VSTRNVATPMETTWAAGVWQRMCPHERIAIYFATTGFFDKDQERAHDNWYNIDSAARREIANTLMRWRTDMLEAP